MRTYTSLHGITADQVSVRQEHADTVNFLDLQIGNFDLTIFFTTREELRAAVEKLSALDVTPVGITI